MKVIILGGFLGAGKTSVLLQLARRVVLQHPDNPNAVAIIENEIGDISVDDQTLGGTGGYQVENLFSGCVCCTLQVTLIDGLRKMREELDPEYVVIEPSGVADPGTIVNNLHKYIDTEIRVVVIVDAQRWSRYLRAMGQIIPDQIGAAQLILLNKVDKVDNESRDQTIGQLRSLNTSALIECITANKTIEDSILDKIIG